MTPYLEEHADLLKEDDVVFSSPLRMRPSERVKVSRRKDVMFPLRRRSLTRKKPLHLIGCRGMREGTRPRGLIFVLHVADDTALGRGDEVGDVTDFR